MPSAFSNCPMTRVLRIVHYEIAGAKVRKDGIAIIQLRLFEFDSTILNVVPAGGGERVDGRKRKGNNRKSSTSDRDVFSS